LGDYTYRLSLWVEHPDADLSDVPEKLGLTAHRLWKKGDRRMPKGRDTGGIPSGVHRNSYCNIRFNEVAETELPDGIKAALDLLRPHKDFLMELTDAGVQLSFFVGWYSEFNSRDVLDWAILRDMADLRISLDLDFYGPDPTEVVPAGLP
jgi:hypothetical protein